MSDSTTGRATGGLLDATGAPMNAPAGADRHVLDSAGQVVPSAPPAPDLLGEITDVVRQRPIAALLLGIGFGLLLGRLTA